MRDRDDVSRLLANIDQSLRMFGHHREPDTTPEEPGERIGEDCTDKQLEAELAELEDDQDDVVE